MILLGNSKSPDQTVQMLSAKTKRHLFSLLETQLQNKFSVKKIVNTSSALIIWYFILFFFQHYRYLKYIETMEVWQKTV